MRISPMHATAAATSNIALVKYWGKRDVALNLPATGSISITLDQLATHTTVSFEGDREQDSFILNGTPRTAQGARVSAFLDLVRALHGTTLAARVETRNDFPTGAGLASSASGFAALAVACDAALGLGLSQQELSVLARRGSGSAARSILGGFAEMRPGERTDGFDAFAVALAPPEHVPLHLLVAVTTTAEKATGSTAGMHHTEQTSPYHEAWLSSVPADLEEMRAAVATADLERIGTLAESNALRMHADMLAARPPLVYWTAATVAVMQAVAQMRREGLGAWFTIDAGPQVKVLCDPTTSESVAAWLSEIEGVREVIFAAPGAGAHVVEAGA